jgi:hypothetical protein
VNGTARLINSYQKMTLKRLLPAFPVNITANTDHFISSSTANQSGSTDRSLKRVLFLNWFTGKAGRREGVVLDPPFLFKEKTGCHLIVPFMQSHALVRVLTHQQP